MKLQLRMCLMKQNRIIILFCCFIAFYCTCNAVLANSLVSSSQAYIDLTHTLSRKTPHWAVQHPFQLITTYEGYTPNQHYYSDHRFSMMAHAGTHIDAPKHFFKQGEGVAAISLRRLIGNAVMIDVSKRAEHNPDYQISVKDLMTWQKHYGKIPLNSIILFNTGYENYWFNRRYYFGTNKIGRRAKGYLHFPGLSLQAAEWLAQHQVKAVGIDTASIDYGVSKKFPVHQFLAKHHIPVFENLTNLNKLMPRQNYIIALPMKVAGSSGAPLRIIAALSKK